MQVKRVGKYEIGKTLGEGTFGKVKFAVNTETGEKVAIKILDKEKIQKQNMGAQIKKEISIMKMVKHHNIVKLYEVLASRTKIFIVLELITGGELFDKIVAESRFDEKTARFYFRQLIKGVKYCHGQGVCHRDLKPENLLLDEHSDLKISDFGLSALYTGSADDEGRATVSWRKRNTRNGGKMFGSCCVISSFPPFFFFLPSFFFPCFSLLRPCSSHRFSSSTLPAAPPTTWHPRS